MSEVYSLFLMEAVMQNNGVLSLEDAWRCFFLQFPNIWNNYIDFESFVLSQHVLFEIHNNYVYLKDLQTADPSVLVPTGSNTVIQLTPATVYPPPLLQSQTFSAETEAVKYFQRQISRRNETWIPIKSLAGHLSQASPSIRAVVGPQSDFMSFLLRHPRVFEVQGDLVSLRDDLKLNLLLRPTSHFRQSASRRNRPQSMLIPSPPCAVHGAIGISDYLNIHPLTLQSSQNPAHYQSSSVSPGEQKSPFTIFISVLDYVAVMWLRKTLNKFGGSSKRGVPLQTLMQELISAPKNVRDATGWTQIEVTEFLSKFSQLFEVDELACKNKLLDKSNTTFVIVDSTGTDSNVLSLVNRKGVAYCVAKSWGIIDLGQHEHVFFDRSLFKHVENLTKHFTVGETLYFNAILAPKESRAKWRATHVWKESDVLAAQLSGLVLPTEHCPSSSEENSDSGVQDATVKKSPTADYNAAPDFEKLLIDPEFNVVRLDTTGTDKLLILQEPENIADSDDDELGGEHSDRSSSDLNTMSDIPSISSCLPDAGHAQGSNAAPGESFVSSGTQTYSTGDILAKQVYHEGISSA
ncbi:unnamed protein product [Mesocestoides corti]|uniref:DUF3883 domain-containing protein n=1 Tax=Mesocestoides corti TaxID=53468 RepID=A0A0R3UK91_MESCO|nr:unnamed protein product [Mesocestoides corti]